MVNIILWHCFVALKDYITVQGSYSHDLAIEINEKFLCQALELIGSLCLNYKTFMLSTVWVFVYVLCML